MKNVFLFLLTFSYATTLYSGYPEQYVQSLSIDYDTSARWWFTIPEDVRQNCTLSGKIRNMHMSGNTMRGMLTSMYMDSLVYEITKINPQGETDFNNVGNGEQTYFKIKIDSVVNKGIDLSSYVGNGNSFRLAEYMADNGQNHLQQRLRGIAFFGLGSAQTDSTEVWMELVTNKSNYNANKPAPTLRNYRYTKHWERGTFDFWKANSTNPAPLLIKIHGGGWGGSNEKYSIGDAPKDWLDKGFAVVALNYRFLGVGRSAGMDPPCILPLYDAARAVQFIRSIANELNIDPNRIGTTGGSAGGCTSLWLLYHDDIADPSSNDPIARYSSKIQCAAVVNAQTSLNPYDFDEWPLIGTTDAIYVSNMAPEAFGISSKLGWEETKEAMFAIPREVQEEYSPITHVSSDDGPVYQTYTTALVNCSPDSCDGGSIHHAQMGVALKEKTDAAGIENVLCIKDEPEYPNPPDPYGGAAEFLIAKLMGATRTISHDNRFTVRKSMPFNRTSNGNYSVMIPTGKKVILFDAIGKCIAKSTKPGVFTTPSIPNGIYFYSISGKGKKVNGMLSVLK